MPPEEAALLGRDSAAADTAEALQFASGKTAEELEEISRRAEHARDQRFRDHFEKLALCALWLVGFAAFAVGTTWLWHLVTPVKLHWLETESIRSLQNLFTGGVLAAVAAEHWRKRMK